MGKGKGNFFCDIAPVKSGKILFELEGLSDKTQLNALLANISSKLPIKIRLTGL
jgi:ribosomal protein L16/L10AE